MKLFTLDLPHSDEEVHYRDYRINGHKFAFDRIQYNKGGLHNMERIAVPVISKSDGEPVANLETTVILVECGNIHHYLDNGFAVRLSDAQMVTVANEILKKRAEVRGTGLKTLSGWRESGLPSVEDYLEVGDEVDGEMLVTSNLNAGKRRLCWRIPLKERALKFVKEAIKNGRKKAH